GGPGGRGRLIMEALCLPRPVVGDDGDPTPGHELARDALPFEAPSVGVPSHRLLVLSLAETLQEPHAAAVGVEGVHVIDDDELVAVAIEPDIHPEGGGIPLDPAGLAVEDRPDGAALGQSPGSDQDQKMEVPLGERPKVLLQPLVGRDVEGFLRVYSSAFGLGRHASSPPITSTCWFQSSVAPFFRAIWRPACTR